MRYCLPLVLVLCACKPKTATETPSSADAVPAAKRYDAIPRNDFNGRALEHAVPLFWREDDDKNQALDPNELEVLWGHGAKRSTYVDANGFTAAFDEAYTTLKAPVTPKDERQRAVQADLSRGRPSLAGVTFAMDAGTKQAVEHLLDAAELIERLYQKQQGVYGMDAQIAPDDTLSRSHFHVNQGPWCSATGSGPECNALASRPPHVVGLYPADLQADKDFCAKLEKLPDAEKLLTPFTVVVRRGDRLEAVPYNVHFAEDTTEVAKHLSAAADALPGDEAALVAYLRATAAAFMTNDWFAADEAWAKMNADNSKWYVRVGPDEVYDEPCNHKAMFHMTLARINPGSKTWTAKLTPLRTEMEALAAELSGKPYKARDLAFHMPDFIDVLLNAGDDRAPRGATVGQSLPNFGPVGEGGRGRTVVMVNFYVDADNRAAFNRQAASVLCADTMSAFTEDHEAEVMSTVLHEATHNFGPAQGYAVNGKSSVVAFGGADASMLEELKAQTGAMVYTDWLVAKGSVEPAVAKRSHIREVLWMFGHISRGMVEPNGKPRPYSQLAAIQAGTLVREGVLTYDARAKAANGSDVGCFSLDLAKLPQAVTKLGHTVFGVKARNDVKGLAALKREFVDTQGPWKASMELIGERWRREPQATFVYAVRLD